MPWREFGHGGTPLLSCPPAGWRADDAGVPGISAYLARPAYNGCKIPIEMQ
jgi:hypothetical protein